jgi:hypothetical protein
MAKRAADKMRRVIDINSRRITLRTEFYITRIQGKSCPAARRLLSVNWKLKGNRE